MTADAPNQQRQDKTNPSGQTQQQRSQPSSRSGKSNANKQQQDLPAVGEAGKQQQQE